MTKEMTEQEKNLEIVRRIRELNLDFIKPATDFLQRPEGLVVTSTKNPAWIEGNALYAGICPDNRDPQTWWDAIQLQFQLKGVRPKSVRFVDKKSNDHASELLKKLKWQHFTENALFHSINGEVEEDKKFEVKWIHPKRDPELLDLIKSSFLAGRLDIKEDKNSHIARYNVMMQLINHPEVATGILTRAGLPVLAGVLLRQNKAGLVQLLGFSKYTNEIENFETKDTTGFLKSSLRAFLRNSINLANKAGFKGLVTLALSDIFFNAAKESEFSGVASADIWIPESIS